MKEKISRRLRIFVDVFMPILLLSLALNLAGLPAWVRAMVGALAGGWGCRTWMLLLLAARGVRRDEHAQDIHSGGEKQHGVAVYAIVGAAGAIAVESRGCLELSRLEKAAALRHIANYAGSAADAIVEAT